MTIKQEVEAAAVAVITCPSCGAAPNAPCHYIGSGGGLARLRKVQTHQRRLSAYISGHMIEKLPTVELVSPETEE